MWHILVVLFGLGADAFRCWVVCAHKRPNVTSLPGSHIPLSGTILVPFGILSAEFSITLHLQLVFGHCCVPPIDAHFLSRPVRWFEMAPVMSCMKKISFFSYRNDHYYYHDQKQKNNNSQKYFCINIEYRTINCFSSVYFFKL
jgi:hypothetical protein